jgi:hypothetical protein
MSDYVTELGSLNDYRTGGVDVIDDDPKNYVFSNVFDVARHAAPYERIAVAKNFEYVIEAVRAEGKSVWFTAAHDEFALCMDGEIEIQLVKLSENSVVEAETEGAVRVNLNASGEPQGLKMGRIVLRRGHQALLPAGSAYRFEAPSPSVMILQTLDGELTVHKWAEICQTASRRTS